MKFLRINKKTKAQEAYQKAWLLLVLKTAKNKERYLIKIKLLKVLDKCLLVGSKIQVKKVFWAHAA